VQSSERIEKRPTLRLRITSTAEWKVRSGHPWIFADSIKAQNRTGSVGELAVVYDKWDNFLAVGLFDPYSPLRVRVLHTGKPQTVDDAWWRERFASALRLREGMFDATTTGYRCIHGENDGWPALVLDRFGETAVMKLYSAVWFGRMEQITALVREHLPVHRLVVRLSRNVQKGAKAEGLSEGAMLFGAPVESPVLFRENGLVFEADVLKGQKTGFFLDQRDNRKKVGELAGGRSVLNTFSFSGGFSVYAARGGAMSVTDVDISAHALEAAGRNFLLNSTTTGKCAHELVKADAFDWLAQAQTQFGIVVLDPPSLAKKESDRKNAMEAYARLASMGIERVEPGGLLVAASCSAHVGAGEFFSVVRTAARKSGRRFAELAVTGHPADHPAKFPEASYLKCIYLQF
jgi:23S rRNA (cytosine1962-C5)-methyltransferase